MYDCIFGTFKHETPKPYSSIGEFSSRCTGVLIHHRSHGYLATVRPPKNRRLVFCTEDILQWFAKKSGFSRDILYGIGEVVCIADEDITIPD